MSTTSSTPNPAVLQAAKDGLTAVKALVDVMLGQVETQIPTLEPDALEAALSYVDAVLPGWAQLIFNSILSTANLAAHSTLVTSLTAGQVAAVTALQARIDADLTALINKE